MFSFPALRRHINIKSFSASSAVTMALDLSNSIHKEAVVRTKQEDPNLTITLTVVGKVRILNRPKTEPLSRSLERLRLSFSNPKKKNKKRKEDDNLDGMTALPHVALYSSDTKDKPVDDHLSNEEAWSIGKCLVAGDTEYKVTVNPPTVEKLEMKDKPMVGHPIYPICTLSFADENLSEWNWFRKNSKSQELVNLNMRSRIYTPKEDDLGCYLQAVCTPGAPSLDPLDSQSSMRFGQPYTLQIGPIEEAPKTSSGNGRHEQTNQFTESPIFRIVSYNVLAGAYTSRPNAIEIIFKYCNPKFLDIDYRKQLILKEIHGYNADILCLQEVDNRIYETYLKLHLSQNGYDGIFTQKSIETREGCATFFRQSRFSVLKTHTLRLNKILDTELPSYLYPFQGMIASSEHMRNALQGVGTIAQITLLRPLNSNERMLCIANTHLISRNYAEHIRLLHVFMILNEAKKFAETYGNEAQIILTGDLNSSVENGIFDASVQLLKDGCISADHWEWKECSKFTWKQSGEEEEEEETRLATKDTSQMGDPITGISLTLPFTLESAMSLDTPWTNYTDLFKGLLDYIWYEPKHLQLKRIIPLPTEEQLEGPIPSEVYPSDHLAIIADLEFIASEGPTIKGASIENLKFGVDALNNDKIIGVPTDTIYGLAAKANDSKAIHQLYSIKGRSFHVPLAICVANPSDIAQFCFTDHLPSKLLEHLLPGSVTVILNRKESKELSQDLNPGLRSLGVRVPDCQFLRLLCEQLGHPIALTSANSSGEDSSINITQFQHLWHHCAVIYDAGEVSSSFLGSTVIDLTRERTFKIIRRGDGLDSVLEIMQNYSFLERKE